MTGRLKKKSSGRSLSPTEERALTTALFRLAVAKTAPTLSGTSGVLSNLERTIKQLGCDFHSFKGNWQLTKRVMLEALIRKGDACWHCHTGIFAYPMQVAIKEQTPLIIWGEPSSTYTAYYTEGEVEEVDEDRFDRFVNLGITADDMAGMIKKDFDFDYRDLRPYTYPKHADLTKLGVRSICLGSYHRWDVREQVKIIEKELGWKGDEVEGMPGMWPYEKIECSMQGVRDYIKHLKRGYSRVSQMCAIDIRNGRMTTEDAKEWIAKYEGGRPPSLDIFLGYVGITEAEFNDYVRQTVVSPNVPDFDRGPTNRTHDFKQWYREPCSPSV